MNLTIKDEQDIINYLITYQDFYINILNSFNNNYTTIPARLKFYPFFKEDTIDSLLCSINTSRYYTGFDEEYAKTMAEIINDKRAFLFSIYGKQSVIDSMTPYINKNYTNRYEYYVMKLLREDYTPFSNEKEGYICIPGTIRYFKKLKDLQYDYHLEEVYTDGSAYPYNAEMKSFKELLKHSKNYVIFTDDTAFKPVSKCNVNGESPNLYQLGGIFTQKSYRNQGLSSLCLTHLLNDIFENNHDKNIILYVKKENKPAIHLYQKFGFKILYESIYVYY